MRRRRLARGSFFLALLIACASCVSGSEAQMRELPDSTRRVVFQIDGLRSERGHVRGAVFDSERAWPHEGREIARCAGAIRGSRAECVITGLGPGRYAFAFLHDEDDDGRLDRDWIGIPSEGFGFSNDAPTGLGPPSFSSAAFTVGGEPLVLHARVRYGL